MKDENYLKENGIDVDTALEILGDIDMYNETLQDFLQEVAQRINDMQHYIDENDMTNYAILAHSMKSDSKYLGFTNLASISLEHEMKGKENDYNYIKEHFNELKNETNRIIGIINSYLN